DVWAPVRRAPASILRDIGALPGVRAAEARVEALVTLGVAGRTEAAVGQILSLPATGLPHLNRPVLRSGRLPRPEAADEVAVSAPFAAANGLIAGDTLRANLNGNQRDLRITGTLLSPEFVYALGPGAMMPDRKGFAIIWMPERAAQAAFDMSGAFNN